MNQKAAAPLTHDFLARKGEARAARRLHETVNDHPLDTGQHNPAPQPQNRKAIPARRYRFVAISLALGLLTGVASYLLFANSTGEMPDRILSTQDVPLRDAAPVVLASAAISEDKTEFQTASGPAPQALQPVPVRPADAPRIPAENTPAMKTVLPPAPPAVPEASIRTAEKPAVVAVRTATDTTKPKDAPPPVSLAAAAPVNSRPVAGPPQQAAPTPPKPVAVETAMPVSAPAVKSSMPHFALQLASLKSEDVATRESARLQRRLSDTLTEEAITVERANIANRGVFFRLKVGNFSSKKQATDLCHALKQKKQPCLVVRH